MFHYDPCPHCGERIVRSNTKRFCPYCGMNKNLEPKTSGPIELDLPRVCKTCRSRLGIRVEEKQIVVSCKHTTFIYNLVGISSDTLDADDPTLKPGETTIWKPPR